MTRNRPVVKQLAGVDSSLSAVAKELGLDVGTVSRIAAGKYQVRRVQAKRTRARVLSHIAEILDQTVEEVEHAIAANLAIADADTNMLATRAVA